MSNIGIEDLTPCWGQYKFILDDTEELWHVVNVTNYEAVCGRHHSLYGHSNTRDPLPEKTICPGCIKEMRDRASMVEVAE